MVLFSLCLTRALDAHLMGLGLIQSETAQQSPALSLSLSLFGTLCFIMVLRTRLVLSPLCALCLVETQVMTQSSSSSSSSTVLAVTATALVVAVTSYWITRKHSTTNTTTTASSQQQALEMIQQRRSIFPKHYANNSDDNNTVSRQVLEDMLEAARWAPSHHLTEPWHFVVFKSASSRRKLGMYLAHYYKTHQAPDKLFQQKKYDKKLASCLNSGAVISICVSLQAAANPAVEEVLSVAAAVQNMHLIAAEHRVGAYWSTSGIYTDESKDKTRVVLENPPELREFLELNDTDLCLGWMYVGSFGGNVQVAQGTTKAVSCARAIVAGSIQ